MDSNGTQFMLKEYERLHAVWRDSLSRSEQRVNFFLTIASAVTGALLYLLRKDATVSAVDRLPAAELVLALLLCFGLTTLNRVVWGSEQRRVYYDRLMSAIRECFAAEAPEVERYVKLEKELVQGVRCTSKWVATIMHFHRGRLTDFMISINSLICGVMVGTALNAHGRSTLCIVLWGAPVSICVGVLLYLYYQWVRKRVPLW